MIGERLSQIRQTRNLTLEALAARMGGIVTKQSLSKYELNQAQPSPLVLTRLAAAFGVKAHYFLSPIQINVQFVAYRKSTTLLDREKARVESTVTQCLEDRIRIQTLVGQTKPDTLPWKTLDIASIEEAETQASQMRKLWDLGSGPIRDVVATLEDHQLCVLAIDADEKFDGLSALGSDASGNVLAGAIISRQGLPGERQRLNLTHELGHLVLKTPPSLDEELAAFRFGAAFLVPADRLISEVGAKRSYIHLSELLILKKQFGMSLQALLHRMLELGIINDSYYRRWCVYINRCGWRKHEPEETEGEIPQWLGRNLRRLLAEGAITRDEAERMLGASIDVDEPLNAVQRHAFLELPIDQRRELLEEQVGVLSDYYEEAEDLISEDLIDDYQ